MFDLRNAHVDILDLDSFRALAGCGRANHGATDFRKVAARQPIHLDRGPPADFHYQVEVSVVPEVSEEKLLFPRPPDSGRPGCPCSMTKRLSVLLCSAVRSLPPVVFSYRRDSMSIRIESSAIQSPSLHIRAQSVTIVTRRIARLKSAGIMASVERGVSPFSRSTPRFPTGAAFDRKRNGWRGGPGCKGAC